MNLQFQTLTCLKLKSVIVKCFDIKILSYLLSILAQNVETIMSKCFVGWFLRFAWPVADTKSIWDPWVIISIFAITLPFKSLKSVIFLNRKYYFY